MLLLPNPTLLFLPVIEVVCHILDGDFEAVVEVFRPLGQIQHVVPVLG